VALLSGHPRRRRRHDARITAVVLALERVVVDDDDLGQEHVVAVVVEVLLVGGRGQIPQDEAGRARDDEQRKPVTGACGEDVERDQGEGQDEPDSESGDEEPRAS